MRTKPSIRLTAAVLALVFSTSAWAGGGAPGGAAMFRPAAGVHVAGHAGSAVAPHAGLAISSGRARFGAGRVIGYGLFGHTRTAFGPGVWRHADGYGHVRTGLYGYGRAGLSHWRNGARYAFGRRRPGYGRYGYGRFGYGGYPGFGLDSAVGSGVYGEPSNSVYVMGGGDDGSHGTTQTGEGLVGTGFAEPPLNEIGYGGGPEILTVHNGRSHQGTECPCEPEHGAGPIVYRFGVGSYY